MIVVRVLLVNMPWASIDVPSLALGILEQSVTRRFPDADVQVVHANIDYVDWVTEKVDFGVRDYYYYSLASYFIGCGDWVFSSALYDDPEWRMAEYTDYLAPMSDERGLEMSKALHRLSPEFVRTLAERVVAAGPDVVGFTSTFQQNAASLAAARQIKALDPSIVTIFGGANCDGAQGEALHRNFPFADNVLRGEGETAFPDFLAALRDGGDMSTVPGLCWRTAGGECVANPMSTRPLPPGEIVSPSYTGYFERLAASVADNWVEPKLVVEGARGCWWGEKHHCTFCGLNGSFMQFRSKSPDAFYQEIIELVERHQVLDMFVVDNILDMGYVNSLLPRLIESGYDMRLQYEIKANMKRDQLQTLHDAGLVHVQPGIENLNTRVLRLMDKGVTGCQNIRMLRDAESAGISVSWNYLYGFPGESEEDYAAILDQVPALVHLAPPDGAARIEIERFSPYFNRPELGFSELRPARQYRLIYDLPEAELHDLAYLFAVPPRGIGEQTAERLGEAMSTWELAYPYSRLTHCDLGDQIVLVSRRAGFDWTTLRIVDPVGLAAFRQLDQPRTVATLVQHLTRDGHAVDADSVNALLARWLEYGVVFADGGQYIQIAPEAANRELLRIDLAGAAAARRAADASEASEASGAPVAASDTEPAATVPA